MDPNPVPRPLPTLRPPDVRRFGSRASSGLPARWIRPSLLAGSAWFAAVALAHVLGVKAPGLFLFFAVPSYAYQDRIIGSLAAGWAVFFALAALRGTHRRRLDGPLAAGLCAIAGLSAIAASPEPPELAAHRQIHALQIAGLAAYWTWLAALRHGSSPGEAPAGSS